MYIHALIIVHALCCGTVRCNPINNNDDDRAEAQ